MRQYQLILYVSNKTDVKKGLNYFKKSRRSSGGKIWQQHLPSSTERCANHVPYYFHICSPAVLQNMEITWEIGWSGSREPALRQSITLLKTSNTSPKVEAKYYMSHDQLILTYWPKKTRPRIPRQ